MNFLKIALIFLALAILVPLRALADCDHVGAFIINLSQDEVDKLNPDICTSLNNDDDIEDCAYIEAMAGLPTGCGSAIDIFVPGTNQEYGSWKQFNHMFRTDNNRGHLSLQYEDAREVDNDLHDLDLAKYDQGVIDARESLIHLLNGLIKYGVRDIRVFGHSKGSHSVALVADEPEFRGVQFFAFAQAGRTAVDISARSDIVPGKLGNLGYIQKLSSNLVGITFRNDEVRIYTGSGFSGVNSPKRWHFPGWIKDGTTSGGNALNSRIDHHNNYGGYYTDGLSGNDWRAGEGSKADNKPYCLTGDPWAWGNTSECAAGNWTAVPWFWGHPECQAEAFRMMNSGSIGERYYIGNSGPRDPRSCRESQRRIRVDVTLRYKFNIPDKDCIHHLLFGITDRAGNGTGSFRVKATKANDDTWRTASVEAAMPYHMRLNVGTWLEEDNDGGNCAGIFESEVYIDYLKFSYVHPGTGERVTRMAIGNREGRDAAGRRLDGFDETGWSQPNRSSDEFVMEYDPATHGLRIEGEADDGHNGDWTKPVYLLD